MRGCLAGGSRCALANHCALALWRMKTVLKGSTIGIEVLGRGTMRDMVEEMWTDRICRCPNLVPDNKEDDVIGEPHCWLMQVSVAYQLGRTLKSAS